MRNFYREFFYVPKYGKVREKVIVTHLFTMAVVIVLCLTGMGASAYAYFSHSITSVSKIQTVNFEIEVEVLDADAAGASVEVLPGPSSSYVATLKAGTEYLVTLKGSQSGRATTGFVIVTAEGFSARYHISLFLN